MGWQIMLRRRIVGDLFGFLFLFLIDRETVQEAAEENRFSACNVISGTGLDCKDAYNIFSRSKLAGPLVVPFTRNRQAGTDDNLADAMGIVRFIDSCFRFHCSAGAARLLRLLLLRRRSEDEICRIHTTTASGDCSSFLTAIMTIYQRSRSGATYFC